MKITLNFEVSYQAKKNGTYPIFLRATENGHHFKLALDAFATQFEGTEVTIFNESVVFFQ